MQYLFIPYKDMSWVGSQHRNRDHSDDNKHDGDYSSMSTVEGHNHNTQSEEEKKTTHMSRNMTN